VAVEVDVPRRAREPEAFLPLSPPVLNILLALGGGRLHPYGIMQEIDRRTGGKAVILPGTLYTSIARMLDQGLVEDAPDRPEPGEDDERRRYYRLTKLGRAVVGAEVERLAALIRVAQEHNLAPGLARAGGEPRG
jgi:DNA-binding PadR family transcriptional regulator